ncbi:hypothetical protein L3V82_02295 [Thiotrichales bacterium 19S3-7]|nr:hypothetical protein [Thiotrichales bacterium 19S3-7]MCF6800997.1 hypothetical protein [Thiotrichales bacterium 19S3-11]
MLKPFQIIIVLLIAGVISGCATLQSPYPKKMQTTKKDVTENNAQAAIKAYKKEFSASQDPNLYALELGRINQLNNDNKASLNDYANVIQSIRQAQMKAKIQVSKMLSSAGALATSDLELAYDVPDYEQTFLYAYQAKNYLALNDLSNALVSIRRLSQAQAWIQRQNDISSQGKKKINDDYSQFGINERDFDLSKHKEIASMQQQVKNIANAYENGFAYYLEAILYEADDYDYNDAFISIKNALRLTPDNPYVQQTYQQMKIGFNGGNPFGNKGRLVVLYESGLVETKHAFYLPLPLGNLGIQNLAIPYYSHANAPVHSTIVSVNSDNHKLESGTTALLVDTNLLAAKSLTEQYPAIITREVLRLILKSVATYQLNKDAGLAGWLAGSVYSIVTSRADLRSWLLLPQSVQLYESLLNKGTYNVRIGTYRKQITINPQKTTLLWVNHIGNFFNIDVYQL